LARFADRRFVMEQQSSGEGGGPTLSVGRDASSPLFM
jgi:hypothetical protein